MDDYLKDEFVILKSKLGLVMVIFLIIMKNAIFYQKINRKSKETKKLN